MIIWLFNLNSHKKKDNNNNNKTDGFSWIQISWKEIDYQKLKAVVSILIFLTLFQYFTLKSLFLSATVYLMVKKKLYFDSKIEKELSQFLLFLYFVLSKVKVIFIFSVEILMF